MKTIMTNLKHLFAAVLLLYATVATASNFAVAGIDYYITSTTNFTVEVSSISNDKYSGDVVIPESVIDIGYLAFTSGTLYIEAESKPAKWDRSFYGGTAKVYWGNEWEYNEEGIPVLIK